MGLTFEKLHKSGDKVGEKPKSVLVGAAALYEDDTSCVETESDKKLGVEDEGQSAWVDNHGENERKKSTDV